MGTYDVSLPVGHQPRWPDACISCGNPSLGAMSKVAVGVDLLGNVETATVSEVTAPTCTSCERRWSRRAIVWAVPTAAASIVIAGLAMMVLPAIVGDEGTEFIAGLGILVIDGIVVVAYMRSKPLRVRHVGNNLTYSFRSHECGAAFARMNNHGANDAWQRFKRGDFTGGGPQLRVACAQIR